MEEIHVIKFILIFGVIVTVLWMKKPLYLAISLGLVTVIVLYQIRISDILNIVTHTASDWSNISIVLILYAITFLQRMLEFRKQILYAYEDLDTIFHSRRVNATIAALFIGLLPSAAAMRLCGDIIKEATDGYLDKKEQAFITSWFRHIPESALPTYSSVLLMSGITGIAVSNFILAMVIPMIILFLLGYIPYITKLPRKLDRQTNKCDIKSIFNLTKHLWTLFSILFLILLFDFTVLRSVIIIIVLAIIIYKFTWRELKPIFKSAIEVKLLVNTALGLLLKEFISFIGTLNVLPDFFNKLPIPMYLVFVLLFFFGTLISGTNGIIALGGPIVFASIPNGGLPLMVLLMSICHVANQISPTHLCLIVATEYYGVTLKDLMHKTLPIIFIFSIFIIMYYQVLVFVI